MNALRFLSLFAISLALVFASFGIASAAVLEITNITAPANVSHSAGSFPFSFYITYTGADASTSVDFATSALTQGTGTVSIPALSNLILGQAQLVSGTVTFPSFQSGSIGVNIVANPSAQGSDVSAPFSVPIQSSSALSFITVQEMTKFTNGTFKLKNTGNQLLSNIGLTVSGDFSSSLSLNSIPSIQPNSESSIIQIMRDLNSALRFGANTVTVQAKDSSGILLGSQAFTIQGSFCSNGPVGANLSIGSVTIRNSGEDDLVWNPLDEVTVKVDVDNNGLADMREVYVKIGLFDNAGGNKIGSVEFTSTDDEEISLGTINDGGTEKATFEFKIPADFRDGGYKLAVKAYSKRTGESKDCADQPSEFTGELRNYEPVSVEKRSDDNELIAITNFQVPDQNICGTTISGSFDVVNVGDTSEDQVLVRMIGTTLGLNQEFEIREDVDSGDVRPVNFDIQLPSNVQDGTHRIIFRTSYDFRNNGYHLTSKEYEEIIHVIGCSGTGSTGGSSSGSGNAAITATLGSDAKAGEKLVVNAVVRNLANSQQTFVIDAKGYQSWATLDSISDRIITLGAGESKSIAITLNVDSSATSPQEFTIESLSNGKTTSQIVDVKLAASTSSGFSFAGNGLIWVIGAINLVLIILIIVVAVRVSRR